MKRIQKLKVQLLPLSSLSNVTSGQAFIAYVCGDGYVCVCVVYANVCACAHIHRSQKKMVGAFLHHSIPNPLGTRSPISQQATHILQY